MKKIVFFVLAIVILGGVGCMFSKKNNQQLSEGQKQVVKDVGEANIRITDPHTGFSGNVDFINKIGEVNYNNQKTKYEIKDLLIPYDLDGISGSEYPCLVKAQYSDNIVLDYLMIAHRENDTQFNVVDIKYIGDDAQIEDIHKVSASEIAIDALWGNGNNQESVILTYTFSGDKIIAGEDNIDISKIKPERQQVVASSTPTPTYTQQKQEQNENSNGTVVLSFDDGPGASTPDILDILNRYNIKADFFMIGQNVQSHPDYVQKVYDAGNEIGNHTFTHQDLAKMSSDTQNDEFNKTNNAIKNVLSKAGTIWMRPPYGSYSDDTDKVLSSIGMKKILWNVDPRDWAGASADEITDAVLSNVKDGAIVLMHDGVANSVETAKALPKIIEGIQSKGFKIVTLSQMKNN